LLLLFMLMIRSVLCFVWAENIMRKGKWILLAPFDPFDSKTSDVTLATS